MTTILREPLFLLVGDDWRARRFIRTVLKYSTAASMTEASDLHEACSIAGEAGRPVDLLIVELACEEAAGDLARVHQITARNPSMKVLLISGRGCPPCGIPPDWRYLSIPFTTAALLDAVNDLAPNRELVHHS